MKKLLVLATLMVLVSQARGDEHLTINGEDVGSINLSVGQSCTIEVVSSGGTMPYIRKLTPVNFNLSDLPLLEIKPEAGAGATATPVSAGTEYQLKAESGFVAGVHFVFRYTATATGQKEVELRYLLPPYPTIDAIVINVSAAPAGTAFTYQGRLSDGGAPAHGDYDFEFKLYNYLTGGDQFGLTVNKENVSVNQGNFTVKLDFVNDSNVFNGDARWLAIGVRPGEQSDPSDYAILEPRQELTPSPYAIYALNGLGSSGFWAANGNNIYNTNSGNVGIGTASPVKTLDVRGDIQVGNNQVWSSSADDRIINFGDTNYVYIGEKGADDRMELRASSFYFNNGNVGIGTSSPSEKFEVAGTVKAVNSSGTSVHGDSLSGVGVYGYTYNGTAIYGRDGSGSGLGWAGYFDGHVYVAGNVGIGTSSPTEKLEVAGTVKAVNSSGTSVYGDSLSGIGVYGYTYNGTAIYGRDGSGSGAGYAGYFDGNVHVAGSINKSACSFKIDHPVEPETKYLYHSVVESPDMKNVYDGVAVLDGAGEVEVKMPEWFEALNHEFRYQLTCIGGFAPVYIAQKISNNQFKIAGGEPGMEVSWQVTGIRQDAYAEANRIPVEKDKPEKERGTYLHPEAFGLGVELGINYKEKQQMAKEREFLK
ncbi:MAG: hypothetical protein GY869_00475 [Planctomycetes bacterium]|nr:hypothetical protein [Planctomycetota bacterium]